MNILTVDEALQNIDLLLEDKSSKFVDEKVMKAIKNQVVSIGGARGFRALKNNTGENE